MIPSIEVQTWGSMGSDGPDYAQKISDNGYIWWYLDALSDDKTETDPHSADWKLLLALLAAAAEKERQKPRTIAQ